MRPPQVSCPPASFPPALQFPPLPLAGRQSRQQEDCIRQLLRDRQDVAQSTQGFVNTSHCRPSSTNYLFQHLLAFLFAELGTSGAIDGSNQLIMKGAVSVRSSSSGQWSSSSRSVPAEAHRERAEAVHQGVRHLPHLQVSIHVTPVTRHLAILSRSPDTILNKETRLFFLQCMTCHSSCSVQTIKTGFQVIIFFHPSSPPP